MTTSPFWVTAFLDFAPGDLERGSEFWCDVTGYRLYLGNPTPEQYARIFRRYAERSGAAVPPGLVDRLMERYRAERRPFRSCEPRDLIERARDYCALRGRPLELSEGTLGAAWVGYFGNRQAMDEHSEAEEQQSAAALPR